MTKFIRRFSFHSTVIFSSPRTNRSQLRSACRTPIDFCSILASLFIVSLIIHMPSKHQVSASVRDISIKDMFNESDAVLLVTIAKVESVDRTAFQVIDKSAAKIRLATADVIQSWKGGPMKEVQVVVSPTHYCDNSSAEKGQKMILFLRRYNNDINSAMKAFVISHAGRGRMFIVDRKGKSYASIFNEVRLPDAIPALYEVGQDPTLCRLVDLDIIKRVIESYK